VLKGILKEGWNKRVGGRSGVRGEGGAESDFGECVERRGSGEKDGNDDDDHGEGSFYSGVSTDEYCCLCVSSVESTVCEAESSEMGVE